MQLKKLSTAPLSILFFIFGLFLSFQVNAQVEAEMAISDFNKQRQECFEISGTYNCSHKVILKRKRLEAFVRPGLVQKCNDLKNDLIAELRNTNKQKMDDFESSVVSQDLVPILIPESDNLTYYTLAENIHTEVYNYIKLNTRSVASGVCEVFAIIQSHE